MLECVCVCVGVPVCVRWLCCKDCTVKLRPKVQVLLSDTSDTYTQWVCVGTNKDRSQASIIIFKMKNVKKRDSDSFSGEKCWKNLKHTQYQAIPREKKVSQQIL